MSLLNRNAKATGLPANCAHSCMFTCQRIALTPHMAGCSEDIGGRHRGCH